MTKAYIQGQYKTTGEGFIAGKNKCHLKNKGLSIAPQHVNYQIELNKTAIFLSVISISIASFPLLLGFIRNR
jgi:hypothetical protein